MLLRPYRPESDYAMITTWHLDRGGSAPPAGILPRLGVVAQRPDDQEDIAAIWLYMDNSVGVCFPEHIVTRPGLSLSDSRGALLTALDFLREEAAALGYGIMIIHTLPAIARTLERNDLFHRATANKVTMVGTTKLKN